jgi:hypothetical protein
MPARLAGVLQGHDKDTCGTCFNWDLMQLAWRVDSNGMKEQQC